MRHFLGGRHAIFAGMPDSRILGEPSPAQDAGQPSRKPLPDGSQWCERWPEPGLSTEDCCIAAANTGIIRPYRCLIRDESRCRSDATLPNWMKGKKKRFPPESVTDGISRLTIPHLDGQTPPLLTLWYEHREASAPSSLMKLDLLACTHKSCRFIPHNPAAAYINQGHLQCCLQSKV